MPRSFVNLDETEYDWPKRTDDRIAALGGVPRTAGGAGSGNFGHAGRPGEVGGSAPGGVLTPEERQAVSEYVGNYDPPEGLYVADGLNGLLRGVSRYSTVPETYTPEQEAYYRKQTDVLQRVVEKTPTTEDRVFYRGVDSRLAAKLVDGTEFIDQGFTSITSHREIAYERFTGSDPRPEYVPAPGREGIVRGRVFEIRVPKGTPLLDVDSIENPTNDPEYTTEREHLLGHGTRFRVRNNVLEVVR